MNTKDFEVTKDLQLNSITHGKVSLEEAVKYIVDYLSVDTKANLISQPFKILLGRWYIK